MTDTINDVAAAEQCRRSRRRQWISSSSPRVCWRRRKEQGVELVGSDGLLNQLIKRVLETALEAEMSEHLGYGKYHPTGRTTGTPAMGSQLTDALAVERARAQLYQAELLTRMGRGDEAAAALHTAQAGLTEEDTAAVLDDLAHAREVVDSER